jgi:hypothetical protein
MAESFSTMLAVGGKSNSLGRVNGVIELTLHDQSRLSELYDCLFNEDAWVRMRAADALEKVCRIHPEWLEPYTDRLLKDFGRHSQASIRWHLAQIVDQVTLTPSQRQQAQACLSGWLQNTDVDWIVAANALETLAHFTSQGHYPKEDLILLLKRQQKHHSKSVVKRATKLLESLE